MMYSAFLLASSLATSAEFPAIHRLSSRALNPIPPYYTVPTIVYELYTNYNTVCLLIKEICHSLVCGNCGGKCHWVRRQYPTAERSNAMLAFSNAIPTPFDPRVSRLPRYGLLRKVWVSFSLVNLCAQSVHEVPRTDWE